MRKRTEPVFTTTLRLTVQAHQALQELSARTGLPMGQVVDLLALSALQAFVRDKIDRREGPTLTIDKDALLAGVQALLQKPSLPPAEQILSAEEKRAQHDAEVTARGKALREAFGWKP